MSRFDKGDILEVLNKFHAFWQNELTEPQRQIMYNLLSVTRSPDHHADEAPNNADWLNVRKAVTLRMRAICFANWCTDPSVKSYLNGITDEDWKNSITESLKKMPAHYQSHYSLAYHVLVTAGIWKPELEPKAPLTEEQCFYTGNAKNE